MPDTNSQLLLHRGYTLWKNGDLQKAEACCRSLIADIPGFAEANHLLGLILKQSSNDLEAEKYLKISIRQSPHNAEFYTNLANLYRSQNRLDESLNMYLSALQCNSDFRPARIAMLRLLNLTDPQRAADVARQFIAQTTTDAELWALLGQALKATGEFQEAEQVYRHAIQLNPQHAIAHHNLGVLLSQINREEEALDQLQMAENLGLRTSELEHNRANALLALNRGTEADFSLRKALQLNPTSADSHMMLANIRFMQGDANYLSDLEAAIGRHPKQSHLWAAYGNMLRDAQHNDAAIEALKAGIRICGTNTDISLALATTLLDQGHYAEALAYARRAAATKPDDLTVKSMLVSALLSNALAHEAKVLIFELRQKAPLNQEYIAFEAIAARLLEDPIYHELYDFDEFVRTYAIEPPSGWQSITDFHRDLIPELEARHRFSAHPLNQSLRCGTQTARSLLADKSPIIGVFLQSLAAPLEDFRNSIGFSENHPLLSRNQGKTQLSGCWSVRLGKDGFHVNHIHPQGWISSAYYVDVPEETKDQPMKNGWLKLGEPRFHVPGVRPERFIQPKPGTLVLFPSYMWHGTTPITGNEQRLTIAFDAITRR